MQTDAKIIAAVNAHQRTDKGFGPALGPAAAQAAVEQFERLDYAVMQGVSDWVFQPGDREIQTEILSGWASAARETGDVPLDQVIGWLTRRRELVSSWPLDDPGRSRRLLRAPDRYALSRQIDVE